MTVIFSILFAETNCRSHHGIRHERCQSNNECYRADKIETDCPKESPSDSSTVSPPDTPISQGCEDGEWRCQNGKCIQLSKVCDTINNCGGGDTSDEELGKTQCLLSMLFGEKTFLFIHRMQPLSCKWMLVSLRPGTRQVFRQLQWHCQRRGVHPSKADE